ncbi:MAG: hypothetical protein HOE48_04395 [Candidatus Latescibacteria bacterium]|nr:hypothetical protein [Candidatus Latescibacterota bacterium]
MQHTYLFADDHHILYRSGTQRIMTSPKRHSSNPLILPDKPWEVAIGWTSIYHNPETGKYQLWYQSYCGKSVQDKRYGCVVCYAESDDGIHFVKPDLDLFSFENIEQTNIVLIGSGGHSFRYCNSVLVDDRHPDPNCRYKMTYFDWAQTDEGEFPGLHVAFSPDGTHWNKYPEAPLLKIAYGQGKRDLPLTTDTDRPWAVSLSMSDASDVFFDPTRQVYAWYGKMWIDGPDGRMGWKHAMGRTESTDFINWTTPQLVCAPDDNDLPHVEFHTTPVFYHQGLYLCLNQLLNRAEDGGVINIELMLSRDGLNWNRPFRNTFFLARGDSGNFDSGSIFTNATPVILEHEIRFYYGAYSSGATGANNDEQKSGVGLATLPKDRFACIAPLPKSDLPTQQEPLENIGQITLKPTQINQYKQITLNADATNGTLYTELLSESGQRVPGYTKEDSVPIQGDAFDHTIAWKNHTLQDLDDRAYMMRIHLDNAVVYAMNFST